MVANLQQVDDRERSTTHQHRLDRSLGVAGEKGREPAVPYHHDHGSIVDVALGQGRRRLAR